MCDKRVNSTEYISIFVYIMSHINGSILISIVLLLIQSIAIISAAIRPSEFIKCNQLQNHNVHYINIINNTLSDYVRI